MLILVGVSVTTIQNGDLFGKAREAASETEKAKQEELDSIDRAVAIMNGTDWKQDGSLVKSGTGEKQVELNVGDYVEYASGNTTVDNNGWRVIGAENGELLLISANTVPVKQEDGTMGEYLCLEGREGYATGVSKLNEICTDYLNAEYANRARSVTVEDINRVTGYDPMHDERFEGRAYNNGKFSEYGKTITYYWNLGEADYENMKGSVRGEVTENPEETTKFYWYGKDKIIINMDGIQQYMQT